MFTGINSDVLQDPCFKEDSVRELVISPIVTRLGYLPSGPTRVTRSKSLKHPFIRVGTRNHPVTTIPDYTFFVEDKPLFVLDAKAPDQDVLASEHVQQAYSYAIHPEIRCEEFGLCNGREIAVFSVAQRDPILHLNFIDFETKWGEIEKILAPNYLKEPMLRKFAPDLGTAFSRMGIANDTELVVPGVRLNLFARISDNLMTATANADFGFGPHCASFDFHPRLLEKIVSGLPSGLAEVFVDALNRAPFHAAAGLVIEIDASLKLGDVTQGQSESFIPLLIDDVLASRFNPEPLPEQADDLPPYVFNLRNAFVMKDRASED